MKPSTLLINIAAVSLGFLVGGALMGTNWIAVADPGLECVFGVATLGFLLVPLWLFDGGLLSRLARWLILVLAVALATCSFGIGFIVYYMRQLPIS